MHIPQRRITFALAKANNAYAQMAELVDALVSNTSGVKSIPVRSRVWVHRNACKSLTSVFLLLGSKRVAKKIKIELKSGIIHKKTGLLIDAKTTVQPNVFFQKHIILKEIVC